MNNVEEYPIPSFSKSSFPSSTDCITSLSKDKIQASATINSSSQNEQVGVADVHEVEAS